MGIRRSTCTFCTFGPQQTGPWTLPAQIPVFPVLFPNFWKTPSLPFAPPSPLSSLRLFLCSVEHFPPAPTPIQGLSGVGFLPGRGTQMPASFRPSLRPRPRPLGLSHGSWQSVARSGAQGRLIRSPSHCIISYPIKSVSSPTLHPTARICCCAT